MGGLYILRPDNGLVVEVGHTISITKQIRIEQVTYTGRVKVRNSDSGLYTTYDLNNWDWEIVTPCEWPVQSGDVWKAKGIKYAAIIRNSVIALEPMNSETAPTIYPEMYDRFLADYPVLILRG